MATYPVFLLGRISWTEPSGPQPIGSLPSDMTEATEHAHTHTSGTDSSHKGLMDTEAQRGGVICPRSHSKISVRNPGLLTFRRHSLIRSPEHTPAGCGQRQRHLAVQGLQQREKLHRK